MVFRNFTYKRKLHSHSKNPTDSYAAILQKIISYDTPNFNTLFAVANSHA